VPIVSTASFIATLAHGRSAMVEAWSKKN